MGGALRLLDLVDYPTYMVAMNALPPVPALVGDEWVDDVARAASTDLQPWLLRWLEEQRDSPYWRHGSLRPGYDRIACPTMLVGGWADGYRNNTFRTVAALAAARRRRTGCCSARGATCRRDNSLPGPHIDLVPVMARWWDRWLRGVDNGVDDEPALTWFQQHSTLPGAGPRAGRRRVAVARRRGRCRAPASTCARWVRACWRTRCCPTSAPPRGTAARERCPGASPTDQRYDDAASLTWSTGPPTGSTLLGHPRLRLRLAVVQPVAFVSAKLCDVFPDGTSSLLSRGLLNLTHRDVTHRPGAAAGRRAARRRDRARGHVVDRRPPDTGCACRSPASTGRTRSRRRCR